MTQPATTTASGSGLGRVIAEFRFGSGAGRKDFLQSVLFLVGFIAFFIAAPYIPMKGNVNVRSPVALLVWAAVGGVLIWLLWGSAKNLLNRAIVHEHGIHVKNGKQSFEARWDQITAVHECWHLWKKHEMSEGVPLLNAMVLHAGGRESTVNNTLSDFGKLARTICANCYRIIEDRIRKQIQSKQPAAFGDLAVTLTGLVVKKQNYPWSQIKWIGFPEELGSELLCRKPIVV